MAKHSLPLAVLFAAFLVATATDFYSEMGNAWGAERVQVLEDGNLLQLTLDQTSGSGYQSKNQYLFGRFDVQMKLVPGNSAGTVTAFYLQSPRPNNNQIDFEFLGNVTDQPYVLHTNLYTHGQGNREQQIYLWFDPRQDFHTYSVLWSQHQIVWYVDGIPVRVYRNVENVPYPNDQPLSLFATIWNASEWATMRGQVGIDWSQAPFTAQFRNLNIDACMSTMDGASFCPSSSSNWQDVSVGAGQAEASQLQWVRQNYMIYNYCNDPDRFPQGLPQECSLN